MREINAYRKLGNNYKWKRQRLEAEKMEEGNM
jgi:hypothetical protein